MDLKCFYNFNMYSTSVRCYKIINIHYKREITFAVWFSLHASASGELVGDVLNRLFRLRTAPDLIGWEDVVAEDGCGPICL